VFGYLVSHIGFEQKMNDSVEENVLCKVLEVLYWSVEKRAALSKNRGKEFGSKSRSLWV